MKIIKIEDLERWETISTRLEGLSPKQRDNQITKDLIWMVEKIRKYAVIIEKDKP